MRCVGPKLTEIFPPFCCRQELTQLRAILDSAKSSASEKEKEVIKAAIARYGDLAYELSGLVNEVSVAVLCPHACLDTRLR